MNEGDEYEKVKKKTKRLEKIIFGIILSIFIVIMAFCFYIIVFYIIYKKPKFDLITLNYESGSEDGAIKTMMDIAFEFSRTAFGSTFFKAKKAQHF